MFSTLRHRFGIPGVISAIALVFAMFGGAYAANDSSDGKSATASAKKAVKGPRGPKGPKGATGAAGPAGAAGASGRDGLSGLNGEDGAKGSTGATGPTGPTGPGGSPWTLDGTLPKGSTQTGVWVIGPIPQVSCADPESECKGPMKVEAAVGQSLSAPLSFTVPLSKTLPEGNVHYLKAGAPATSECPGSPSEPLALSGHLCVYTTIESGEGTIGFTAIMQAGGDFSFGASKTGALLRVLGWKEGTFAYGTWAVTAS